jgi:hypothetical protein
MYMALFGGSLLATAPFAFAGDLGTGPTVTIAVYGDAPYGATSTDDSQTLATPAFIQAINQAGVDAVMHVGDIHSGKQFCTEAYNRQIFTMWSAFEAPLIYTPGDNEWTDCQKKAEGGGAYNATTGQIDYVLDANGNPVDYANGDPIANLALIRSIFFSQAGQSLGRHPIGVTSQATHYDPAHPADANYVENVMWQAKGVLFVSFNLPGGSNNDTDPWYGTPAQSSAQTAEIAERTGADLRWLDAAFARAAEDNFTAVVLQFQADMWDTEKGAAHQTAYEPIVQSIASHALAFGKPVLILNGDSHVYRSDNPLAASDPLNFMHPGYNVPNTHRIVVHGSTTPLEWLRLTVDPRVNAPAGPDAFGPFSWQRVTE